MKEFSCFKKLFCTLILLVNVFSLNSFAQYRAEDVLRASNQNNSELINTLRVLKNNQQLQEINNRRNCDDDPVSSTCVSRCAVRGSSGCLSYGSDYCGIGANCAENCKVRGSKGDCLSYDPDYCGNNVSCHEVCKVRGSRGDCLSYGPDQCY